MAFDKDGNWIFETDTSGIFGETPAVPGAPVVTNTAITAPGQVGPTTIAAQGLTTPVDTAMTDWGMKGLGGTAIGAGQLGLGVLGYFDQAKTSKKQRELLGQQIESNKYAMGKAKAFDTALEGFGKGA